METIAETALRSLQYRSFSGGLVRGKKVTQAMSTTATKKQRPGEKV